ncbi:MAG TPA: hypothetical protein VHG91_13380 [Longimicrobium sp.]|nr:hypothetical protein [Longimicrobium sp.]
MGATIMGGLMMIGLAHPNLLHLVAVFPAVAGAAMLLWARRRRQAAEALGEAGLVRRLAASDLGAAPNARIALVVGARSTPHVGPTAATPRRSASARLSPPTSRTRCSL